MKKFFSMLLCLTLLFSTTTMSTFAAEVETFPSDNVANSTEAEITPYANPTDLYYGENILFTGGVPLNIGVEPTKGRSLRVWLKNDTEVNLTVMKPGLIGYSTVYSQNFSAGERDVEVVSSCANSGYVVKITAGVGTIISILVYETGG